MKYKTLAYVLWLFFGVFSAHRFYLKKYETAIFYLLTFQLLGLGWIYDLFILGGMVDRYNLRRGYYRPIKGLEQSVFVNINTGNKQPKPSPEEHSIAS